MKTKHSPTPWVVSEWRSVERPEVPVRGPNGEWIADFVMDCELGVSPLIAEVNAKHAVRAVNCHDDLLAACKLALLVHDTLSGQQCVQDFAREQHFFPFFDPGQAAVVRAAIAKAEAQ